LEKQEVLLGGDSKKYYYLQRFVISNSLKREDSLKRIEQRIQNRHIDLNHSLESKSAKNLPEEKVIGYFNDKFGKGIELLSKKLNGGNITQVKFLSELTMALISEKRAIRFLHKYELIPKHITTFEQLTGNIEKTFESEMSKFLKSEHFVDLLTSVDEIVNHYDNYNFNSLIDSHEFYSDVLYDKENFKDRMHLFDSLYESKSLLGGIFKTYYECTNCDTGVFSGNVTLNVTPSKVKLKCPNCNKEVYYLAPYKINDELFSDITSKDGLLASAVCNLLSASKIKWRASVLVDKDIEIDVQILNKEQNGVNDIIELKMFKQDRPVDVLIANLSEGLKAFLTAQNKLIALNPDYRNLRYHYLTNITNENVLKELTTRFQTEIGGRHLLIHDTISFNKYIQSISHLY
jgi:hypothetical protein